MSGEIAVVCFPGSNCEHDVVSAIAQLGGDATIVWHTEENLSRFAGIVIPGGFAHGDYIRPGAIAQFSPVMAAVAAAATAGRPVLGICNGFQVLTEARLLPGSLMRNDGLRFLCETVICEVVSTSSVITDKLQPETRLALPINHYEGNFTCDAATLAQLERSGQIVLRYLENPNGSAGAVAGVSNEAGNVVGIMPHPERAMSELLGSSDGQLLLTAFVSAVSERSPRARIAS